MEILISLLVSVMAGVAVHYICKWLDGNSSDNQPKKNPPELALWGICFGVGMDSLISLVRIYYMLEYQALSIYQQANRYESAS